MSERAIESIGRALDGTEDADDALRAAVASLSAEADVEWAGICFLEDGALALGPAAGTPAEMRRQRVPISFHGTLVGELWVDGTADLATLERIAALLAPQVLIGWDTGGEAWEP